MENPSRRENIANIVVHAAHYGYPVLLKRLLSHPEFSNQLNTQIIQRAVDRAATRETFECLYVLYQHGMDLTTLDDRILVKLLRAAIQFDNPKMHQEVKKALKAEQRKPESEPRTQTQRSFMAFKFPNIEEKKPKSESTEETKKSTVTHSKKNPS